MTRPGRTTIACPDCEQPFTVAVSIHPRPDQQPDRSVLVDVKIDEEAFVREFTAHVMADAERHPSFAIPDDADSRG